MAEEGMPRQARSLPYYPPVGVCLKELSNSRPPLKESRLFPPRRIPLALPRKSSPQLAGLKYDHPMKMFLACMIAAAAGFTHAPPSNEAEPIEINGVQLTALNALVTQLNMNHKHARITIKADTASSVTGTISYDDSSGFGVLKPQRYSLSSRGSVQLLQP